MKKVIYFLLVMMISLIAQSCGKFSDGTSVWQAGLWIIPTITGLASLFFLFLAYRDSKSGSWYWGKNSRGVDVKIESKENVPIYKTAFFAFFAILLLVTIGIIIWVNADK